MFAYDLIVHNSIIYMALFPCGPFISPNGLYLSKPVRKYSPNLDRNLIGVENRKRTVIYQWINLINGKIYVGSA